MPGRVRLVVTSPRLPAGQLTWQAWQALRDAPVLTGSREHPQRVAVQAAGVAVEVLQADDLGAALAARVAAGGTVAWLSAAEDGDLGSALRGLAGGPEVEVVPGSVDPPGARLLDVVAVMDRLRSPGGCPWDAVQTHRSLMPYLLEEAYEAYAALEDDDPAALREELGDVLLQVAFHARLAQEAADPWSVDDVAADLVDKLVRRHPHVFAGASADDLERSWDALKATEKDRTSVTDGVPLSQPALLLAAKLQKRAGKLGVPVPSYGGLGGQLWELVRRCREDGLDPEVELRATSRRFRDRLAELEAQLAAAGRDPAGLSPQEWSDRWS